MAKIAYTSDLHLEFLISNVQERLNKDISIENVAEMFCDALAKVECDCVVAGDTSHCLADILLFFSEVDKRVDKPIYTVLGNHDFWNWKSSIRPEQKSVSLYSGIKPIEKYCKKEFAKFNNVKLLIAGTKFEQDGITIIGDCGFSARNSKFNCRNGIYRDTLRTWYMELELVDRWHDFFEKKIKRTKSLLVITHTPPTDWIDNELFQIVNENCILKNQYFIFGHVHDINSRTSAGVKIIRENNFYGDAANGYNAKEITFKTMEISDIKPDMPPRGVRK